MMRLKNYINIQILLIIFGVSFLFSSNLRAQLQNWRFEIPITVANNSGSQLVNYQTLIIINTRVLVQAGYMKADGGDIRFAYTCGNGLIDYFLENYMNTDSTRIWIRLASLAPHTTTTVYMFMGNPAATSTSSLSIFEGPHSSTNYVTVQQQSTNSFSQRGFRFTAQRNLLVTHFGKRVPNQSARYVTLFDYGTQSILSQILVNAGSAGQYNYNQLQRPVWLQQGNQYVLEVFQGAGDKYYFGISSQIGPYLNYHDMRYCNNCTQNTFPTSSYPDLHYGTPDFLYYARQMPVSPEPNFSPGLVADTNTPAPPSNLYAMGGNQQALLTWRKNTEFDADRYYIYRNTINNPNTATQIGINIHPDTTFTASGLVNGMPYYFWTKAADRYCIVRFSGFSNVAVTAPLSTPNQQEIPGEFALYQNYPNPFNPSTEIKYDIPRESFVEIAIFDLIGREVGVLVSELTKPGKYSVKWGSENIPSGIYIYRMNARQVGSSTGDFEKTMKMVLLK